MLAAPRGDVTEPRLRPDFVFYDCEEVEAERNGLEPARARAARLARGGPRGPHRADRRPGRGRLPGHAAGRGPRSPAGGRTRARSWLGDNADPPRPPGAGPARRLRAADGSTIDGCEYREGLNAVRISGGVAGNVVPDECAVTVNFRFAPDRTEDAGAGARPRGVRRRSTCGHRRRARRAARASTRPAAADFVAAVGGAPGEVRLDRRGPVRRPRHPGAELRPGRPQPRAHPRGARRRRRSASAERAPAVPA